MLQRLLLLPLLSPLLVSLVVAALNPSPSVVLRLLTWQTPALPIGLWIAVAAGGGAALSGGATALALRQSAAAPGRRRTVRRSAGWDTEAWSPPWSDRSVAEGPPTGSTNRRDPAPSAPPFPAASAAPSGPNRAPGEPSPTVSVPYRVLHRPATVEADPSGPASPPPAASSPSTGPAMASAEGDWGERESEEW